MKYLLGLILLISVSASAQYSPTAAKTRFVNGIGLGTKDTATMNAADTAAMIVGRDSLVYFRYKGYWKPLAIGNSIVGYVPYSGATTNLNMGNFKITANKVQIDSVQAKGSGGLGLYSNSGTKVGEFGVGGGSNIDFHGFAGYNANRSSNYTVRSFTDKRYVDSVATLKVNFTDTATMLTPYKKAYYTINQSSDSSYFTIQSLSGTQIDTVRLVGTTTSGGGGSGSVSGTVNYVSKFTSTTAVGNSSIFDNGTSVGINNITPSASAKLEIASTTQGFLPPRMTAAQRTSISSPAEGLIVVQTDSTVGLYIYIGAAWHALVML